MIVIDTSALIDSLCGTKRSLPQLVRFIESGERISLPALVLCEWLRGPRRDEVLHVQEELFPGERAIVFGPDEAAIAADLYKSLRSAGAARSTFRSPRSRSRGMRRCGR